MHEPELGGSSACGGTDRRSLEGTRAQRRGAESSGAQCDRNWRTAVNAEVVRSV